MLQAISQSHQAHEVNYKLVKSAGVCWHNLYALFTSVTEVCYCNIQGVDFLIIILAQMHMGSQFASTRNSLVLLGPWYSSKIESDSAGFTMPQLQKEQWHS